MKPQQIVGILIIIFGLLLALSNIYNIPTDFKVIQNPVFVIGIIIIGLVLIRGNKK